MSAAAPTATALDGCEGRVPLARVKAFYFAQFCFKASYLRYMTLYYEADGLTAMQIGTMVAGFRVLGVLATPFWNALADRTKRARTIMQGSLLLSIGPFLLLAVPLGAGHAKFLVRAGALWLFAPSVCPVGSLMDAMARAACQQDLGAWGRARVYGAVGWAFVHLALGPLVDLFGFAVLFAAFLALNAGLFVVVGGMPQACGAVHKEVNARTICAILHRSPLFFANIVAVGAGFSMVEGLLFVLLQEMQASTLLCGVSVVVTVVFELPIFSHAELIYARLGARNMVLLGQAAWVVRAVFYAYMPRAWMVLLIEPLHGFTFAMVWVAATHHVASPAVSGAGLEASAQGLLSMCFSGLGPMIGMFFGGMLFDLIGSRMAYVVFAVGVLASGLVYGTYAEEAPALDKPKDTPTHADGGDDGTPSFGRDREDAPALPTVVGARGPGPQSEAAASEPTSPTSPKEDVGLVRARSPRL